MSYQNVEVSIDETSAVGVVLLNRPDTKNALVKGLIADLAAALDELEASQSVRCIVIGSTSHKYFSCGLDPQVLADLDETQVFRAGLFGVEGDRLSRCRKPVISAVAGVTRGAGFELALMADIMIAGNETRFVLSDITIGLMPGLGGTQRLTRVMGKAKTMSLCLTGQPLSSAEAENSGLVTERVADDAVLERARELARQIAAKPLAAVMSTKDSINAAYETSLRQGVAYERSMFQSLFRTDDLREGLEARLEDRPAHFKHH